MCKSVGINNDENVVHSGSETNIGLVNLHSENVYHGMKIILMLIALLLLIIITEIVTELLVPQIVLQ